MIIIMHDKVCRTFPHLAKLQLGVMSNHWFRDKLLWFFKNSYIFGHLTRNHEILTNTLIYSHWRKGMGVRMVTSTENNFHPKDSLKGERTFIKRWQRLPVSKDYLNQKMNWIRSFPPLKDDPPLEDDLHWKMTYIGRWHILEDDQHCKMTSNGRWPP